MNLLKKNSMLYSFNNSSWDLPTPSSISYFWNFGSILSFCLVLQILSGFFLSFHYVSFSYVSFDFIVSLMREVWSGWIIRFFHMNGASLFFFFIYLHLFRGLYYMSSVHKMVWSSGILILFLLMGISFLGYVLPWGQMSYWAVAVITNLISIVPFLGEFLVMWIWGGFTVGLPTLIRFYSLHFILPFVLLFMFLVHMVFLHKQGSSNPLGGDSNLDKIFFHPYFSVKDFFYFFLVLFFFLFFCFYFPYISSDPVNNVPANFMQTPTHIQPEWYFLPYYTILRSITSKTGGVVALVFSVLVFGFLILYNFNFSSTFSYYRSFIFWFFVFNFIFLMKLGSLPAEEPYVFMSKIFSFFHFFFILILNI